MLNRRSMLFNVVTLTINSNVTSTITIGGEVFTNVTTASKRFKQGTETSYKVEASRYISKSGTVTMSSNASIDVSLSLAPVAFTVTSNVSATITINGDTSTSVKTKTVNVNYGSNVTWSVAATGYVTQSGTDSNVTSAVTKNITLAVQTFTFKITSNVSSTITINGTAYSGVTTKSVTVNYGSNVTWSVEASGGYVTQSGTESNVTANVDKSITLVYTGITSTCTARYIWCTDGSFVAPDKFKSSGKTAYGYALSNTKVASLTKYSEVEWARKRSTWYSTKFTGSQSTTNGVANSNYLKRQSGYGYNNCPAVYYGCIGENAGKTSYMPAIDEVSALYRSIMSGNMKTDLTTADLYSECEYTYTNSSYNELMPQWYFVWSSTQAYEDNQAWSVSYSGSQLSDRKDYDLGAVIPFFAF